MKKRISIFALLFAMASFVNAQSIVGKWKTIDDETGKAKSYVTIYEKDGAYFGKVTSILNKSKKNNTCEKCSDYRKDQPIMGMVIITDLKQKDKSTYTGGKILDPTKGKIYDLTILPNGDNELTLKGGYKVFGKMIGRTQTWYRVNE